MTARILVLNCFVKGWNILKRLADDGFEVNAGHHAKNAPGLHSNRIVDRTNNLIYPDPKKDENAFVDAVLNHISKTKFEIVLPVNAAEMMALARRRDEIIRFSHFPFESYDKLLLLHDKKYFYELTAGIVSDHFLPKSWSIGDSTPPIGDVLNRVGLSLLPVQGMPDYATIDEFIAERSDMSFPVIVKTRRATSAVGIYRASDVKELREACHKLGDRDIIVQENLIGRGVGISSLRWEQPELLYHFGHKRVREYPVSGGASTSREPWDSDNLPLTAMISDVLAKLNWHGVVMFELKEIVTAEGQFSYRFLEANPRFWGSVPLAIANGVNFPVILCRATLGREIAPVENKKTVRARILFSDTLSLTLNILKGRRVWYNLRDFFNFRNLFLDDVDFSDLPGTFRVFLRMLAEFFGRVFHKR